MSILKWADITSLSGWNSGIGILKNGNEDENLRRKGCNDMIIKKGPQVNRHRQSALRVEDSRKHIL